jgi:gentisate 1,2-dioxygenase
MSAAEERLEALNEWLRQRGIGADWLHDEADDDLQEKRWPRLCKGADIYPAVLKAGELVPVGPRGLTEMRNLGANLGTSTISLGYQILMPGERTRAHRNAKNETRFVLEAPQGAVFIAEGEAFPMEEGDLIVSPTWTAHDHHNGGDRPAIWLDGLDTGLMRFGVDVNERYPEEAPYQIVDRPADFAARAHRHMRPDRLETAYRLPPMRYPWKETEAQLRALADGMSDWDPWDGVYLRYANPVDGGATVQTMSCAVQLLPPNLVTRRHRHNCTTIYHAFRGRGVIEFEEERLEWEEGDLFSVPPWTWHRHENRAADDAILFSLSDWPAMASVGFYREERD